jgi:NAD/NADP transhydrogenase beta subunit
MMYALAFASSFFFVGLKSTQQLNVVHKAYWWILPTSMLMAVCEVYVVATVAKNGFGWIVLAIGFGAGLGAMLATWLHSKFIQQGE